MAINGIVTAREAKVVAGELERLATNGTMVALMMALDPATREAAGAVAHVFKGMIEYSTDLKEATSGKADTDEVFPTVNMEIQGVNALAAMNEFTEGIGK